MQDFLLLLPEIVLAATLGLLVIAEITHFGEKARLTPLITLGGLGAALVQVLFLYSKPPAQVLGGLASVDGFSLFFKLFLILGAIFSFVSALFSREILSSKRAEYGAFLIASTLAMGMMASVTDLALAFSLLLLLSVVSQFLVAMGQNVEHSTEAAIKLMVMGMVSLVIFVYAGAIFFGATGMLGFQEIHSSLLGSSLSESAHVIVILLSLVALCFYLGLFPSYFVTPDYIQGAPTPVSGFLAFGIRASIFAFLIRFFVGVLSQRGSLPGVWETVGSFDWTRPMAVFSGASMLIGTLMAFRQTSAKRLVGFLVVAQSGFFMLGVVVLDEIGIAAILFNLVVELFTLVGIFFILSYLIERFGSDQFQDLRGALKGAVPECSGLVFLLVCLVGLPPSPGFIGKFALIGVSVSHQHYGLVLIAVASMMIGMAAVGRLTYQLVGDFQENLKPEPSVGRVLLFRRVFLFSLVLPCLLAGVFADSLIGWVGKSLEFIFW